jgi:hypothetical protein
MRFLDYLEKDTDTDTDTHYRTPRTSDKHVAEAANYTTHKVMRKTNVNQLNGVRTLDTRKLHKEFDFTLINLSFDVSLDKIFQLHFRSR